MDSPNPLFALYIFLYQAVLLLGNVYVLVPFLALVAIMVGASMRLGNYPKNKLLRLLIYPTLWSFIGLWGGAFWLNVQPTVPTIKNPSWVLYPVGAALFLSLILMPVFAWYLRGNTPAQIFALTFATINIYLTCIVAFMAGMAITGDWL